MNQFFYETRGKEKVKEFLDEGLRSQALHRSGVLKPGLPLFLRGLPKFILGLLVILGLLRQ